ncbi:MAG: BTAD domain-containing putative transcriptional regulator [Ktedonobacteraceae bacterium]
MDDTIEQEHAQYPLVRVITMGEFSLERLVPASSPTLQQHHYTQIARGEWSSRGPAAVLLKVLLCRVNRRATKDELIEAIWPDNGLENAGHALDSAASVLRRHVLRTHAGESLLYTIRGGGGETTFRLAGQQRLWVDADALLTLAARAMRAEGQGQDPFPFLEEAHALASGDFLADDLYCDWAQGRRRTINGARHRVLYKLVDLYLKENRTSQAEELLFTFLEQDPTNEDALCRLMVLLAEQERPQEALQLYQYAAYALQEEKTEPNAYTRELAGRLRRGFVVREQKSSYRAKNVMNALSATSFLLDSSPSEFTYALELQIVQ